MYSQKVVLWCCKYLWNYNTDRQEQYLDNENVSGDAVLWRHNKSKMADGRHFENCYIAISQLKIVRFWWNLTHYSRYRTRWQPRDQKLQFLKFKMATAAILKIAFLAITHYPIVWYQQNFAPGSRMACWQRPHEKKLQIFKIQDGGRPPIWKSLNHHISVKLLLDFDKIWCTTAYTEPDDIFKSTIAVS